jgi:hypothetical protein
MATDGTIKPPMHTEDGQTPLHTLGKKQRQEDAYYGGYLERSVRHQSGPGLSASRRGQGSYLTVLSLPLPSA